jgi:hypothetical protein
MQDIIFAHSQIRSYSTTTIKRQANITMNARYLGTGIPEPILFLTTLLGIGNADCIPLCRLGNTVGAPIDATLVLGLVTLCVSEWNEEEDVLRVGDAGRPGAGIPD